VATGPDGSAWRASSSRSRSATTSPPRASSTRSSRGLPGRLVFRIDHYLGKETVQNLLALRFANQLFEPVWNANYVDHVQITMAEDIGIGGRAGYYDGIGAARDVIQNHLLQLLALTAMEEPVSFDADQLRAEKEKVLSAVRHAHGHGAGTARGQYAAGWQGGEQVVGYLQEQGVAPDSTTETYAAIRLDIAPADGRGCRSTCAPASGWASGSPRSRWCSRRPRICRSTTRPPRNSARTRSSSGCSPMRA
jgi:hypothetical protein